MKIKDAVILTLIITGILVITTVPQFIPKKHSERYKLVDGSILKLSARIESYSNVVSDINKVDLFIKLKKISDDTSYINVSLIYLHIPYFGIENNTLDYSLDQNHINYSFIMNFHYSYTWDKVEMYFRLDFSLVFLNGTSHQEKTDWMFYFYLRPNVNFRGMYSKMIGGILALLPFYYFARKIAKRKRNSNFM